jgi:hypothetical protein
MSERKDEKWLDGQLQRAVDGGKPVFDAESWKRKHPEEYQVLLSGRGNTPRRVAGPVYLRWPTGLAVAATILLVVGLFLLHFRGASRSQKPTPPAHSVVGSAVEMLTMRSLRLAYERGGQEALNRQLDAALDQLGPRLNGLSTLRVVRDLDG